MTFIVIYGINNIGKTTQCKKIIDYLRFKGIKAKHLKSPDYKLKSGKRLNKIIRQKKQILSEVKFQKLYAENRLEQQKEIIRCLRNNINVVMEDYVGTSFAWGNVKGLTMTFLKKINKGLLKEDISILLNGKRFLKGKEKVHIHEKDNKLIEKVRKKHLMLAKQYKWHVINANQSKERVFKDIKKIINQL